MIKALAGWIEELAKKMKKLGEDDIKNFIEGVKGWLTTIQNLKSYFDMFASIMNKVNAVLDFFFHPWWVKLGVSAYEKGKELLTGTPSQPSTSAAPSTQAPNAPATQAPSQDAPATQAPTQAPNAPATKAPTSLPSSLPSPFNPGGARSSFNTFGGFGGGLGGAGPGNQLSPASMGWANSISTTRGAGGFSQIAPTPPAPSASSSFGDRFGTWPSAAQKMTPKAGPGGGGGFSGRLPSIMGTDPARPGPLSMNNWQMNRTANLVVRNVPGSNIFMTAAGMTG
jgi:hypothetical protein